MRHRYLTLGAAALSGLVLAGCGGGGEENVRFGETEGIYLDVGGETGPQVKYQVQGFRQINARDPQDAPFLAGLQGQQPGADPEQVLVKNPKDPTKNEVFLVAFVAAFNENADPQPVVPQGNFEIEDTEGGTWKPVPISRASNPFAWSGGTVPPKIARKAGRYPVANSPGGNNPARGGVLIFKIPQEALENRPLELKISPPRGGEPSIVDLDV